MDPLRILVAAQELILRAELRTQLQVEGYLVAEASNGRQVLNIVREEPPNLVFLDIALPNVGCVALLAEFALMHPQVRPRATLLARAEDIPMAVELLTLGASDFLEKPLKIQDVRSSIASALHEADGGPWNAHVGQADTLEAVRVALQMGTFGTIEPTLLSADCASEAASLNVAGVVHEAYGRTASAMKFYRRAIDKDHAYWPAEENLTRLTELRDCGETSRNIVFRGLRPAPRGTMRHTSHERFGNECSPWVN
jgi:DNA-binding response OmpR family regulator